jgi:hypothetical protein
MQAESSGPWDCQPHFMPHTHLMAIVPAFLCCICLCIFNLLQADSHCPALPDLMYMFQAWQPLPLLADCAWTASHSKAMTSII